MTCIAYNRNNKYMFAHIWPSCIDWLIGNEPHVPSAVKSVFMKIDAYSHMYIIDSW